MLYLEAYVEDCVFFFLLFYFYFEYSIGAAVSELPPAFDMLYLEACFEDCPNVRFTPSLPHIGPSLPHAYMHSFFTTHRLFQRPLHSFFTTHRSFFTPRIHALLLYHTQVLLYHTYCPNVRFTPSLPHIGRRVCARTQIHTHTYTYRHIGPPVCACTHIHAHTCTYVHVCVCVCVCVRVCVWLCTAPAVASPLFASLSLSVSLSLSLSFSLSLPRARTHTRRLSLSHAFAFPAHTPHTGKAHRPLCGGGILFSLKGAERVLQMHSPPWGSIDDMYEYICIYVYMYVYV